MTIIQEVNFNEDSLVLTPPAASDPFIHIEWLISAEHLSTIVVFDIENSDGSSPAELIILQGTMCEYDERNPCQLSPSRI